MAENEEEVLEVELEVEVAEALRATGHNRPPNRPPKFMTDDHWS